MIKYYITNASGHIEVSTSTWAEMKVYLKAACHNYKWLVKTNTNVNRVCRMVRVLFNNTRSTMTDTFNNDSAIVNLSFPERKSYLKDTHVYLGYWDGFNHFVNKETSHMTSCSDFDLFTGNVQQLINHNVTNKLS